MADKFQIPLRGATQSESDWFKKSGIPGMYSEGSIVLNPHIQMSDKMREAIIRNETVRGFLAQRNMMPVFSLTPNQTKVFMSINNGNPYGSMNDIRHTILARILSGDPSALDVTYEQEAYAEQIRKLMNW